MRFKLKVVEDQGLRQLVQLKYEDFDTHEQEVMNVTSGVIQSQRVQSAQFQKRTEQNNDKTSENDSDTSGSYSPGEKNTGYDEDKSKDSDTSGSYSPGEKSADDDEYNEMDFEDRD